ncbi:MAG: tetrahydromethanopterin S-methyltransferase subunit A [Candidatus Nitrosopolaris wilkensis]|nr:MAG: tetrahydromethanopterin S-methyltransferase subunit A [Candidatus Nitrosopolaris wilkensis]
MANITFKKMLENVAGRLCEILIPMKDEYFIGKGKTVAICTLSSMDLLQTIARTECVMNRILIVGRLLSENKGIDTLIKFTLKHPELRCIVICGNDVKGHQSGQALLSLYRNGVSRDGKIIGATGPHPFLTHLHADIESFRKQIMIYDLIKCGELETVKATLSSFGH